MRSCNRAAAIIPLGRDSHHGSSSLPEVSIVAACAATTGVRLGGLIEPGRLSPPICLAPRGVSVPRLSPNERWALTHRFTLTRNQLSRTSCRFPARCHRLHSTGGLFSVALSVNRTARMTCAAAPLTLSGALPNPKPTKWTAGRRFPTLRRNLGVRTFLRLPRGPQDRRVALRYPRSLANQRSPGSPAVSIITPD